MDLTWVQAATDLAYSAGALSATIRGLPWTHIATDFAVSGGLSATIYGATAFVGVGACTAIAGPVVGVVVGGLASGYVGSYAYEWARDEVVEQFYERPMDPTAEMAGRLVGGVVGGSVGAHYGAKAGQAIRFAWQYPNYVIYDAEARSLTERSFSANRQTIDPKGLRGPAWHLDHGMSVRQGYEMHIPPAVIAAPENLSIITAEQNLSAGAKLGQALGTAQWSIYSMVGAR